MDLKIFSIILVVLAISAIRNVNCDGSNLEMISVTIIVNGFYRTENVPNGNGEIAFQISVQYKISTIIFQDSQFHSIPINLFKVFPNAKKIQMENCGIKRLKREYFVNGEHLVELHLGKNKIQDLPPEVFAEMPGLQILDLAFNQITELDPDTFKGLQALKVLRMERNAIKTISSSVFAPLTALEIIHLHYNHIESLPNNIFLNNLKLRRMYLQGNVINSIDLNAFSYLDCPNNLEIGFCNFETIHLPSINYFIAQGSHIKECHIGGHTVEVHLPYNQLEILTITNPSDTKLIDIRFNKMRNISFLKSFKNLTKLRIGYNPVDPTNFTSTLFHKMENLEELDMSGMSIISLPENIFIGLRNLKSLDLNKNFLAQYESICQVVMPILNIDKITVGPIEKELLAKLKSIFKPTVNVIGNA